MKYTKSIFVAIDVDDNAFNGCVFFEDTGEESRFKTRPSVGHLIKKLENISSDKTNFKLCYEATYLGYSLFRDIVKHGYSCEIIAPSLIPTLPGKQVKTDKLDAQKLCEYYRKGMLTSIFIPDEDDEKVRDLLRSRGFLVKEIQAVKKHILSLCRRNNINYKEETGKPGANHWTVSHRIWLGQKINKIANDALKHNLVQLINIIEYCEKSLETYDQQISQYAIDSKYQQRVKALVCFKGIKELTALSIVMELGDVNRFGHPKHLAGYLGFDLQEYTSGGKEKKFHITKMGNKFIRTCLVESCQMADSLPHVSNDLKQRRKKAKPEFISIADRCMQRLYKKSSRLKVKNKNMNKIKVACAREMVGFIWEALRLAA